MTCTKATPDCNGRTDTAITEAAQDDPIQHTEDAVTDPIMTHHISHTTNHPNSTYPTIGIGSYLILKVLL